MPSCSRAQMGVGLLGLEREEVVRVRAHVRPREEEALPVPDAVEEGPEHHLAVAAGNRIPAFAPAYGTPQTASFQVIARARWATSSAVTSGTIRVPPADVGRARGR